MVAKGVAVASLEAEVRNEGGAGAVVGALAASSVAMVACSVT